MSAPRLSSFPYRRCASEQQVHHASSVLQSSVGTAEVDWSAVERAKQEGRLCSPSSDDGGDEVIKEQPNCQETRTKRNTQLQHERELAEYAAAVKKHELERIERKCSQIKRPPGKLEVLSSDAVSVDLTGGTISNAKAYPFLRQLDARKRIDTFNVASAYDKAISSLSPEQIHKVLRVAKPTP